MLDGFQFISLHFLVIVLWVIMFIVLNCIDGHYIGTFFTPKLESMYFLGSKDAIQIANFKELWRLWAPAFMHYSLPSLVFDIFIFLYFAPKIEHTFGMWRMIIFTILVPPLSILFSLSIAPNNIM
mmetsp:Transcript_58319/g.49242  ORF Transcript_58319/g.49242 Transcript_58319/m.49242 type:complete len:125 (+) Transcript_58319:70-444(+)